jgi:hypothetical protein
MLRNQNKKSKQKIKTNEINVSKEHNDYFKIKYLFYLGLIVENHNSEDKEKKYF